MRAAGFHELYTLLRSSHLKVHIKTLRNLQSQTVTLYSQHSTFSDLQTKKTLQSLKLQTFETLLTTQNLNSHTSQNFISNAKCAAIYAVVAFLLLQASYPKSLGQLHCSVVRER